MANFPYERIKIRIFAGLEPAEVDIRFHSHILHSLLIALRIRIMIIILLIKILIIIKVLKSAFYI